MRIRITASVLIAGVSILIAALFMEAGLRLAGVVNPGSFYTGDLERGWALRPRAAGWALDEGRVSVRINSDGLRDREHEIQKPPNTFRIAVLGDSYTEAMNVPIGEAFWSVLERELLSCHERGERDVEVINFGVSGYGTAQELLTVRTRVWRYSPDLVLLAFYTGNDLFNNHRALNYPEDADNTPYFLNRQDGLVLDNSFRNSPKFSRVYRWLFDLRGDLQNHSRLVQVAMKAFRNLRVRSAQSKLVNVAANAGVRDLEDLVYLPPADRRMMEAWQVTEALLLLMDRETQAFGARLWIATLSNRAQVNPNPDERRAFLDRLGTDTPFYPDLRLRVVAEKAGVPISTLAIPLAEYAARQQVFLNGGDGVPVGEGHWNRTAHRLAGELLAADICPSLASIASGNRAPTVSALTGAPGIGQ
jgi:hypothetical protein